MFTIFYSFLFFINLLYLRKASAAGFEISAKVQHLGSGLRKSKDIEADIEAKLLSIYQPEPPPSFLETKCPLTESKDFAVSFLSLYGLVQQEHRFYTTLKYVQENLFKTKRQSLQDLQRQITSYLNSYETEFLEQIAKLQKNAAVKVDQFVSISHPFIVLWMIQRCVYQIRPIITHFRNMELLEQFYNQTGLSPTNLPTKADLKQYETLLRNVHYVYDGDISEFASGVFDGFATGIDLDPTSMIKLGVAAIESKHYFTALEWLSEALSRATEIVNVEDTVKNQKVRRLAQQAVIGAVQEHDLEWSSDFENHPNVYSKKIGGKMERIREINSNKFLLQVKYLGDRTVHAKSEITSYMPLCQGQNWLTEDEKRELTCWYDREIPILPFKFELVHKKNPAILQIHEFISAKSASDLIRWSYPHLRRTSSADDNNSKSSNPSKSRDGQGQGQGRGQGQGQGESTQGDEHETIYGRVVGSIATITESKSRYPVVLNMEKLGHKMELVTKLKVRLRSDPSIDDDDDDDDDDDTEADDEEEEDVDLLDDSYDESEEGETDSEMASKMDNAEDDDEDSEEISTSSVTSFLPGGYFLPRFHKKKAQNKKLHSYSDSDSDLGLATLVINLHRQHILGGRTVFPALGVYVDSEPRSAYFTHHLSPDGTLNRKSISAECPVILGRKWVFTKSIARSGNEFCPKNES